MENFDDPSVDLINRLVLFRRAPENVKQELFKSSAICHDPSSPLFDSSFQEFLNRFDNDPRSSFQRRVFDVCCRIPKGYVTTYKCVSEVVKGNPRAVGQALRHNPYSPLVPCHRILSSDFSLGGFNGTADKSSAEVHRKRQLLSAEGLHFTGSRLAKHSLSRVLVPSDLVARHTPSPSVSPRLHLASSSTEPPSAPFASANDIDVGANNFPSPQQDSPAAAH
mmetsp:Transcript_2074/g.3896  ORF Transcript_2074/g.3896 Transcript_2074/m.3896 type:complete len:222 (-) Transcript_2074:159-824(-)